MQEDEEGGGDENEGQRSRQVIGDGFEVVSVVRSKSGDEHAVVFTGQFVEEHVAFIAKFFHHLAGINAGLVAHELNRHHRGVVAHKGCTKAFSDRHLFGWQEFIGSAPEANDVVGRHVWSRQADTDAARNAFVRKQFSQVGVLRPQVGLVERVNAVRVDDEEDGVGRLVGPLLVDELHALARLVIGREGLPRREENSA